MIPVQKSPVAPASLQREAGAARARLEQTYDADEAACQQPGTPALKPLRRIYAARDVKARLKEDQHGKCAYCEARFGHSSPGDVEHYRPKAGYRQSAAALVQGPGYYWLAYEWSNLLYACEDCNRIRKHQLFPLANDPAGRARTHHDDLTQERPLLLNPAVTPDLTLHLTFEDEVAKGHTPEGRASIVGYGLNRKELLDYRRDYLRCLRNQEFLARILDHNPPVVDLELLIATYGSEEELGRKIAQARLDYRKAAHATEQYAGMVRANFPELWPPLGH
ncbi:hypothetical protein [Hymenobacter sp. CRA2]|uniref:hypothetical protein n=1 Tax=Hymenobacter sp. CRA2 TaxID=1955620 RepID=UPI00098F5A81|nr:hypothetical protein [Hymenobacter sp. CRA2]OON67043.1 hypothetical protein B0919_19605 [Hymenobacter sp. CRA2]